MEQDFLISKKYPGLPYLRKVLLYGVEMPSLKDFISVIKTDDEFTLEAFLKMFTHSTDGFDKETLVEAFKMVEPLKPEEIFSQRFNNVEVRAAILKYVSPDKVFQAVESKVIDKCTLTKTYPKYVIQNLEKKLDSSAISSTEISVIQETRDEYYELIKITDPRVLQFLPWSNRINSRGIILLKMICPSSNKTYYEYIDHSIIDFSKKKVEIIEPGYLSKLFGGQPREREQPIDDPGYLIKQALCWQMRKADKSQLTQEEYSQIKIET